jgi:glycosyltransferase involved in cell wall biosynthesis
MSERSRTRATFVIPCLNERKTLPKLLEECKRVFDSDDTANWSILVADNGSVDGSLDICKEAGVPVLHVAVRGYGAALHFGIMRANTEWVIYADADGTYSPRDAVRLLGAAVREDADLVLGSRMKGSISPGAMPTSHRYLGTPVLSFLIRVLYQVEISDCNSGIRCIRKSAYLRWHIRSRGMEFASALLIKAASAGAKIIEVPAMLRVGPKGRVPHLKRWRDGMRHLLVVLAGAPWLFWRLGLMLLSMSLIFGLPCFFGPIKVTENTGIFGPHTFAISTIVGFYGALFFNIGLSTYANLSSKRKKPKLCSILVNLPEDILFFLLVAFACFFGSGLCFLLWRWHLVDYQGLNYTRWAQSLIYLTVIPTTLVVGIFNVHLEKRFDV